MTLPRAYAPMLPEFDAFLFATVGEEVDGVPLSVLSALARLGLDPRDEAVRLAHLTREAAAEQLARMIARLYDKRWNASEAWRIASGLVERLPMSNSAPKGNRSPRVTRPIMGISASSSLTYLALALALGLLVGLIACGYLPFGR
jgi:hypothetical protein